MSSERISDALHAAMAYLSDHPDEARYTDSPAVATLEQRLRVQVRGTSGEAVATDMPESVGGMNSAPSPGWLFRAALASCEATLIAMRAAHEGVTLSRVEVEVTSESDDRGILGLEDDIAAGPLSIAVRATVAGVGVEEAQIREVIEWADAHCPVQDTAARAVPVTLRIDVESA
jgi:uncharacterized OsmC-like protein